MGDNERDETKKYHVPELLEKELTTSFKPEQPMAEVFIEPAPLAIINRINANKVDSYRKVVEAEDRLMGALVSHAKAKDKLRNIGDEIEIERLDRKNKLREAQRTAQQADQQDKLADLDIKTQIAEKEKRLKELTQEALPPKSQAEKWAEELKEEEAKQEHNLNRDMLKQKSKINRLLRVDKEKKKQIEEIENEYLQEYNARRVTQLPPEAIQELEEKIQDIEDLFNQSKAES